MKMKSLLLVTLATLGLTTSSMAQNLPNYVPANGLVGWWPFNGNANDESGNGNDGVVNGATLTTDRFGASNKAYSFDGVSNFINIPFSNSLDITGSITLSSWLKVDLINPAFYGAIIFHGDNQGGRDSYGMGVYGNSGLLQSGKYVDSGTANSDWRGDDVILDDLANWAYVSTTFDVSNCNLKIYVNGIMNSDTTFTSSCLINYQTNLNSFFTSFGGLGAIGQQFFNGKLDDIGIWSRALTQQEITDLYNANICYQTITVTDTLLINTGIITYNPVTYNNTIKIFPNPTNDHITIDYGNFANMNGYQLRIENSLSQEVFQTSITQQSDYLNLTTWGGNGLYFVHIIDAQGNTIDIKKIVLQ